MALMKCKECNQQVSDKAQACPHCGARVAGVQVPGPESNQSKPAEKKKLPLWLNIAAAVAIVIALISIFSKKNDTPDKTTSKPQEFSIYDLKSIPMAATPACVSEDSLNEYRRAVRDKNGPYMRHLVDSGACHLLPVRTPIITIKSSGIFVTHLIVEYQGRAIELYTYRDLLENNNTPAPATPAATASAASSDVGKHGIIDREDSYGCKSPDFVTQIASLRIRDKAHEISAYIDDGRCIVLPYNSRFIVKEHNSINLLIEFDDSTQVWTRGGYIKLLD